MHKYLEINPYEKEPFKQVSLKGCNVAIKSLDSHVSAPENKGNLMDSFSTIIEIKKDCRRSYQNASRKRIYF